MSSVEAAASLFGGDSSAASDPFAVIGSDEERDTTSPAHGATPPGQEHGASPFDTNSTHASQDASSLFGSADTSQSETFGSGNWLSPAGQGSQVDSYAASPQSTGTQYTQSAYSGLPSDSSSQSIYNGLPQNTGYSTYQQHATAAPPANPYAPAAPVASSYGQQSNPYSSGQYGASSYAYDSYRPSANSTLAPTQAPLSSAQAAVDPYKPFATAQKPQQSQYASYTPPVSQPMRSPMVPATMPPPTPASADAFRPKVSNAYDPPIPPPKPKRATSGRSPAYTPAMNTYTPSPVSTPPPPPNRGSSMLSPPPPRATPPPPRAAPPRAPSRDAFQPPQGGHAYGGCVGHEPMGHSAHITSNNSVYDPYSVGSPRPPASDRYSPRPVAVSHPPPANDRYSPRPVAGTQAAPLASDRYSPLPPTSTQAPLANPYSPYSGANARATPPVVQYNPQVPLNSEGLATGHSYGQHGADAQLPPPPARAPSAEGYALFEHGNTEPPPADDYFGTSATEDLSMPEMKARSSPDPYAPQTSEVDLAEEAPTPRQTFEKPFGEDIPAYNPEQPSESYGFEGGVVDGEDHGGWDAKVGEAGLAGENPVGQGADGVTSEMGTFANVGAPTSIEEHDPEAVFSPVHSSVPSSPQAVRQGHGSPKPTAHFKRGSHGSAGHSSPRSSPLQRVSSPLRSEIVDSLDTRYGSGQDYTPPVPGPESPSSPISTRSTGSRHSVASHRSPAYSPYVPYGPPKPSNAPAYAGNATSAPAPPAQHSPYDPYTPKTQTSPSKLRPRSDSGFSSVSPVDVSALPTSINNAYAPPAAPANNASLGQDLYVSPPARGLYAPSPSLLGSNDPLGRTSARIPVFSFGFGGKFLTCFHGAGGLSTGFDVALSSRKSMDVQIRTLKEIIPESALDSSFGTFPGPLFGDPGSPVTSLVRTGAAQAKTRKARVAKYLEDRMEELSKGVPYLSSDSPEDRSTRGKLALLKLLKIMVDNDGLLSGSPSNDSAIRSALFPHLASGDPAEVGSELMTPSFASPLSNAYGFSSTVAPVINEPPISTTTLTASALDKIQEFLVRGERRKAYHYALDQKLWAHAMVIASGIDKEAWKEVVSEFLKCELGVPTEAAGSPGSSREWLRVVYSLFSGQGVSAVQEMIPTNNLAKQDSGLQLPAPSLAHITPMSPNFPSAVTTAQIPSESLGKWPEIVASVISSPMGPETSAMLTALGDHLLSHQMVEGAHCCYLLAPATSPLGGVGTPSSRIILLGSQSPGYLPTFSKEQDSIVLSEILEFALSLKPAVKGQETFGGLPHLQAYKLVRAYALAELGYVQSASKYCESITASLGRPSQYLNVIMVERLKVLADRLTGAPQVDKAGSWIGGKVTKPSLDSLGSWLEGRLTKFIAGEGEETAHPNKEPVHPQPNFSGPFSQYSTISSAVPSASSTPPPPSYSNLHNGAPTPPPQRTGSALSTRSAPNPYAPGNRASSAMDMHRPNRRTSPAPNKVPAYPSSLPSTTSMPSAPHGYYGNGYASSQASGDSLSRKPSLEVMEEENSGAAEETSQEPAQESGWWNSLGNADSANTPTANTFHQLDDAHESSNGFISLMDDPALSVTPSPPIPQNYVARRDNIVDDEDDLGLGNSSSKRSTPVQGAENGDKPTPVEEPKKAEAKPEKPPAAPAGASSGSWLGRLWGGKKADSPAPVKANLGQEVTFYYDKDLKKWVNKTAGAEEAKPAATPPPPSRAQTASPARAMGGAPPPRSPLPPPSAPPPSRPASAIDLGQGFQAKPMARTRSNLVPSDVASLPPTPLPDASGTPPPPMGRPRSQAAKRSVRNRYVDVFQQEGGGA
ncbi:hypothetical protein CONPUDRAFT_97967 [Coniophora puteana RWD-64-598 SS2]|uniref:Protein transport protein sec16 n=1 Tax=Coniophora puteana (strain RWD-64-598) TaxID=741705 RepID=A0A5M3N2N1_CONPW|nr:uncharacterized protein CONPUDRAFT_97967 [Coniophora puteana RWD-64-598 SS2]EIW85171.1 hypothetical protein CONPUDRAFT_97967 [Coniophora puteana RWD-64-598 SS2]